MADETTPDPYLLTYYSRYDERNRLATGFGPLERERTRRILARHLPEAPAVVADIGGGPGVHALWLAERGYEVHLRDPVERHLREAREADRDSLITSIEKGDARALDLQDDSVDAVLLLGPLYHLVEGADRLQAIRECRRIARRGAPLFVSAISRFAPLLEGGLKQDQLLEPGFVRLLEEMWPSGRWMSEGERWFTRTFFHRPDEFRDELEAAGVEVVELLGLEGVGWAFQDFEERWADRRRRDALLDAAERIESESSVLGVSPHLLAVCR